METIRSFGLQGQLGVWLASLLVHLALLAGVQYIPRSEPSKTYEKVSVNVVEKPKVVEQATLPAELPKPEPAPPKAKVQEKKEAPQMPTKTKGPPPPPVMGLSKDSFAEGGKGSFAAPAGNTTMMADDGKRLAPEDIRKLDRDLSEDAKLIEGSFIKPEYTQQAEEAGLEGSFVIEVYIDTKGNVTDAELKKKIGYGMDEKVLNAARQAKFSPRKNPLGQALAGWKELKIRLTLE